MLVQYKYSRYYVSDSGDVFSKRNDGKLKLLTQTNRSGYRKVALQENGFREDVDVHRLVAMLFIENPEDKRTVNHKDGNKSNNLVSNLEWATDSENQMHSYRELNHKGNGLKTFTYDEFAEVLRCYNNGISQAEIARLYGISRNLIHNIVKRKSYFLFWERYDKEIESHNPLEG